MSRFKARLTSWSTHGACFPFLSLHCFVSTSSNERSRVFWLLASVFHSLLLLINGSVIARLPGDVAAEQKIPLAGRPTRACLPDTCRRRKYRNPQRPSQTLHQPLFLPKQHFSQPPLPADVSTFLHATVRILVNIPGAHVVGTETSELAYQACGSWRGVFPESMFPWSGRCWKNH